MDGNVKSLQEVIQACERDGMVDFKLAAPKANLPWIFPLNCCWNTAGSEGSSGKSLAQSNNAAAEGPLPKVSAAGAGAGAAPDVGVPKVWSNSCSTFLQSGDLIGQVRNCCRTSRARIKHPQKSRVATQGHQRASPSHPERSQPGTWGSCLQTETPSSSKDPLSEASRACWRC